MKLTTKILSLLLALALMVPLAAGMAEGDAVELSIYCTLDSGSGVDANDLYWWRYAEYRLAQQGYNVKLNVTGGYGEEAYQGKMLRIGSGNLPDIMFGFTLSGPEIVLYGDTDGMLLDLTPYLNEEDMPNAYRCSQTRGADAFASSISPKGKIYGVPYVVDRTLGWLAGTANTMMVYANTTILDEMGLELPTTKDELLDVLRAAKDYKTADGKSIIPLLAKDYGYWTEMLYAYYGFYGTTPVSGMALSVKDGELTFPAYTEEFKEMMEFMKTLYDEELIPSNYFTMSGDEFNALAAERNFLMIEGHLNTFTTDPAIYTQYKALPPIVMKEGVLPTVSASCPYSCNRIWASAATEHPYEVAALLDLLFEDEAMVYYVYGPVVTDPLGLLEEFYQVNDDGTDLVNPLIGTDKPYGGQTEWMFNVIAPCGQLGDMCNYNYYAKNVMAGLDAPLSYDEYTDCITGETVTLTDKNDYPGNAATSVDAYNRMEGYNAWKNNMSIVRPSILYCTAEESARMTDLFVVLDKYVKENYAQFITGKRSLDDFDNYIADLKAMGMEEVLELYRKGYASYMESVFG